jgi:hypothetical protein
MVIYKALLKYGYSGFKLEILEYCEPSNCIERVGPTRKFAGEGPLAILFGSVKT